MIDAAPPNYFAYLLRLRRAEQDGKWHVTLQDATTGQFMRFESLKDFAVFLAQELGETLRHEPAVSWLPTDQTPTIIEIPLPVN